MTGAVRVDGPRKIRVMHLITGTGVGGAEMMLYRLLSALDTDLFQSIVYSMMETGPVADKIRSLGIEVRSLDIARGWPDPRAIYRLARATREWKPHVLQTWMYHADLLGGLVGKLFAGVPVAWGIHHSELRPGGARWMTTPIAWLCARLSASIPDKIVCCAESSCKIHIRIGYVAAKTIVIPNGFDLGRYYPYPDSSRACLDRFGIPSCAPVISHIARYDPQKDHATFIAAAKLCSYRFPNVRFVLCGDGITSSNSELSALIAQAEISDRVFLLGRCEPEDVAIVMSRSSVTTSSSWAEAFPIVVGEAMSCGTICVVTDVGDSAYIVGETGIVVAPRAPEALAEAWMRVLAMDTDARKKLGAAARRRIETNFSLSAVALKYQQLYSELANNAVAQL